MQSWETVRLGPPCFCFFSKPLMYGFWRNAHDHAAGYVNIKQGRSQDFSKGRSQIGTPSGDCRLYMVYTAALPRVSAGSVIAAWSVLTKDESRWRKYFTKKTNFKKVGFSTMPFTAKILSWRFRHLNIVGCLRKRRPTKRGGSRAPQDTPPPP